MALAYRSDTVLQSDTGRAYAGVRVLPVVDGVAQSIYADASGTPLSEAITNSNGAYEFWIETGTYDLEFSVGGVSLGPPETNVEIYDLLTDGAEIVPFAMAEGQPEGSTGRALDLVSRRSVMADVVGDYNTATGFGTDDAPYLQQLATALENQGGGTILIPYGRRPYLGSDLTLKNNVVLEFDKVSSGSNYGSGLLSFKNAVWVSPTATIKVGNSSGPRASLLRAGLTTNNTSAQVAALWFGTAVTILKNTADHVIEGMILGFEWAIKCEDTSSASNVAQYSRSRIGPLLLDNKNGIWLHNYLDIARIDAVHCWPICTVAATAEPDGAQLKRTGTALRLSGVNDWTMTNRFFSYGYNRGSWLSDCASVTMQNVAHDHVPGSSDGSIGFLMTGLTREIRILGCQTAGKQYGIWNAGQFGNERVGLLVSDTVVWVTTTAAIVNQYGDILIRGGSLRNTTVGGSGVKTASTAGVTEIQGVDMRGFAIGVENFSTSTVTRIDRNTRFTNCTAEVVNAYKPTIASASTITLSPNDFEIEVTGTTQINTITGGRFGQRIVLHVPGGLTLGASGNIVTQNGSSMIFSAGGAAVLERNATAWKVVGGSLCANYVFTDKINVFTAAQDFRNNVSVGQTAGTSTGGTLTLTRGGAGFEGGQITFGYGNNVAGDWFADVSTANAFRVVRSDGGGTLVALLIDKAAGDVTLSGSMNTTALKVGGVDAIDTNRLFNARSYTVATLPTPGTAGRMAWASDCRVFNGAGVQEGPGAGTGGLVVDNGTNWKIAGTNVTAIA